MRTSSPRHRQDSGFTLVEMVLAITITGIIGAVVVTFMANSAEGLATAQNRNQLASAGRVAIDRIAVEIHNALPGSIRTTTATAGGDQCLEFIPVEVATSYINPPFTSTGTTFNIVDIYDNAAVIHPSAPPTLYGVIYPRRANQLYNGDNGASTGWPNFPVRGPIEQISSIADDAATAGQSTVTLTTSHRYRRRSPFQRFFVVSDPVSYCVVGDKLYRYGNYGFYQTQVTQEEETGVCEVALNQTCLPNYDAAPDKMLIVDNIDNTGLTAFTIGAQSLRRNALLLIQLTLTDNGDTVELTHEVLSRSVP
ncbi:MAG: type II secretion system GspH family protein [Pseudomonadales bacterium]|nr:type II secretion system GspH family protein [Pseudomonadales bacterium]